MYIYNIISMYNIIIDRKTFKVLFNPVFFILSIVNSFEILPKHSVQSSIAERFALN